ncbi:MAG: MEKHLA domain-containing protein [Synechococcaceae bacterium WB9_2_112]|nr:MEKHLA domain-containing protein [Synechococcaceae bacterium WB9_2_112]
MPDPSWLTAETIDLAGRIVASHAQAFGRPLLATPGAPTPRQLAQELFATGTVVLAHDGTPLDQGEGPRLIYANRAALGLWRRNWSTMVGMPSSQTAEPQQRASRQQALATAQQQQAISDYSGIRIDSEGRRFVISGARIWTLHTADGRPCGQAAAFGSWHRL